MIVTRYDPPPIPNRQFDWRAWHDEDDNDGHHVGYGRTEQEARDDLDRLDQEREALAALDPADAMAHRDAIGAAAPLNGALADREDHPVALP